MAPETPDWAVPPPFVSSRSIPPGHSAHSGLESPPPVYTSVPALWPALRSGSQGRAMCVLQASSLGCPFEQMTSVFPGPTHKACAPCLVFLWVEKSEISLYPFLIRVPSRVMGSLGQGVAAFCLPVLTLSPVLVTDLEWLLQKPVGMAQTTAARPLSHGVRTCCPLSRELVSSLDAANNSIPE